MGDVINFAQARAMLAVRVVCENGHEYRLFGHPPAAAKRHPCLECGSTNITILSRRIEK